MKQLLRFYSIAWIGLLWAELATAEMMPHHPRLPEPMVFDLIRPLGAGKGELEVNTLMRSPLKHRSPSQSGMDPFGMVPQSIDYQATEWAPEIEYALSDGVAVEFELPFEGQHLEALKFAGQWTLGTGFDGHFIHGIQGIIQEHMDRALTSVHLLYLHGARFDDQWSYLMMIGGLQELSREQEVASRTLVVVNTSVFYQLSPCIILGLESNFDWSPVINSTHLLMPQIHYAWTDHISIQFGMGNRQVAERSRWELGTRVIAEL